MREFKKGKLHSGSKKGPKVKSKKQAVAIALSEAGKSKSKPGDRYNASMAKSAKKSSKYKKAAGAA